MSGPMMVPPPPPSRDAAPNRQPGGALAVASMALGALSIPFGFFLFGGLLALAGIVLGIQHLRSSATEGRTMAASGTVLSVLGLIVTGLSVVMYVMLFQYAREYFEDFAGFFDESFDEWIGVTAPEMTLETLDGETIALTDFHGKRVIVDVWATWCPPCIKEIPHYIDLADAHSPEDLIIIGISDEDESTLKAFVAENDINYYIVSSEYQRLPSPFDDVMSYPTTFFIDRNGVIQDIEIGYKDFDLMSELALGKDYDGAVREVPEAARDGLLSGDTFIEFEEFHRIDLSCARSICAGQWDGQGPPELIVGCSHGDIRVYDIEGVEQTKFKTTMPTEQIAVGRHATEGPRLLGYENWGNTVKVIDGTGKDLWAQRLWMGVNGAHFGDLDGDGTDEVVIGGNGSGGLRALSPEGKRLWTARLGNVWNQAVIDRDGEAMVFASEAGGTVRLFDGSGNAIRTLRPGGRYISTFIAAYSPGARLAYGLNVDNGTAACFDEFGALLWKDRASDVSWRSASIAAGDVTGDGDPEWLYVEFTGDVVVASMDGVRKGRIPMGESAHAIAILEQKGEPAVVAVQVSGGLVMFRVSAGEGAAGLLPASAPEPIEEYSREDDDAQNDLLTE